MLHSPFVDDTWAQGVNTARCDLGADHVEPAPGHECKCGLHAWYCPRLGYASPDLVGGAVALWARSSCTRPACARNTPPSSRSRCRFSGPSSATGSSRWPMRSRSSRSHRAH
jgi:hypothetical protein